MFKITTETIHEVTLKALYEVTKNTIHFEWLLEYNLNLAFSSHVSWIVARDYETVLNERDFDFLMYRVCKHYIDNMDVSYHEAR